MEAAHTVEASDFKTRTPCPLARGLVMALFEDSHTCLLAAHIHVRMHTQKKYDPCIFDLGAGCIHYQGGFVVKAPWRRRKLENYEFSGNSLERVKALLYMRQNRGEGGMDWIYGCHLCAKDVILTVKKNSTSTKPDQILQIHTARQMISNGINILKGRFFFFFSEPLTVV